MSTLFSIRNASLGYPDTEVLKEFSWSVERGERWAIVGPNGAGKTTLIRTLLGLIPLLAGELDYYDAYGVRQMSRYNVGYLPQINNIDKSFPICVEEVISSGLYGLSLSGEEEQERIAQLLSVIGLEDYRKQAIGKLSGGQLQRVLLARALASKPELLILDEPTSFLDKRYKEQFIALLNSLTTPSTTIIMVTHDLPQSEETMWQLLPIGQF